MITVKFEIRDGVRTPEQVVEMIKRSDLFSVSTQWEMIAKRDAPILGGGAYGGIGVSPTAFGGGGTSSPSSPGFGGGGGAGPTVQTIPVGGGGGGGVYDPQPPVRKARKMTWREKLIRWLEEQ